MAVRNEPDLDFAGMPILPEGAGNFYGVDPRTQPNEHQAAARERSEFAAYASANDTDLLLWSMGKSRRRVPDLEREQERER